MYDGTRTYWIGPIRIVRRIKGLKPILPTNHGDDQVYYDRKNRRWFGRGHELPEATYAGELRRTYA